MKTAIPYYRVSTERQGHSGLGLEAQQIAVHDFAKARRLKLLPEYVEMESGKKNRRPLLCEALQQCKDQKALLIIAKIDRLARNVAFVSALMESGVEFIAVDNPNANKLMVHIIVAFAEWERDQISARTREALKVAKERGVILGKYGKYVLSKQNRQASKRFNQSMYPVIDELKKRGFTTVRKITEELNRAKIPTFRNKGQRWHLPTVHKIIREMKN